MQTRYAMRTVFVGQQFTQHRSAWRITVPLMLFLSLASLCSAAEEAPLIVFFYGDDCPSCKEMDEFLTGMTFGERETIVSRHEITAPGSRRLLTELARIYDIDVPSVVPVVFVGDDVYVGQGGRAQESELWKSVGDCLLLGCESPMAKLPRTQIRQDLPRLVLLLAAVLALAWLQLR